MKLSIFFVLGFFMTLLSSTEFCKASNDPDPALIEVDPDSDGDSNLNDDDVKPGSKDD